jgi:predicted chitinase
MNLIQQVNDPYQGMIDTAISGVNPAYQQSAKQYVPTIAKALANEGILTPQVLAYALATAQYESSLRPIAEVNGQQQAASHGYEGGNKYYGRGFIQLTHKSNYDDMDKQLGLNGQLSNNPDLALDPEIAAKILAKFMKTRGVADLANKGDFYGARGPINGSDKAQEIGNTAQDYYKNIAGKNGKQLAANSLNSLMSKIAPPVQAAETPQPTYKPTQGFGAIPQAQVGNPQQAGSSYVVKPGDNLYNIAKQNLGSGNRFNEITGYKSGNPSLIRPGEVLNLPKK